MPLAALHQRPPARSSPRKRLFFDASALAKLVLDEEPDARWVQELAAAQGVVDSTCYCFFEALGVLKTKWRKKRLEDRSYFRAAYLLTARLRDRSVNLLEEQAFAFIEISALARKHRLDLSDAAQLVAVKKSPHTRALVTADKRLARAARDEGLLCHLAGGQPSSESS